MSDKLSQVEKISCLMDDESADSLDWVAKDLGALDCWRRLHIISDVLRDEHSTHLSTDFHHRLMQEIEKEPIVLNPQARSRRKLTFSQQFFKPVAGLAIAASVAAVTVIGYQTAYYNDQAIPQIQIAEQNRNSHSNQTASISQQAMIPVDLEDISQRVLAESDDNSLDSYLLEHMEQSGGGSAQGMLPYVRLAGYDSNQ